MSRPTERVRGTRGGKDQYFTTAGPKIKRGRPSVFTKRRKGHQTQKRSEGSAATSGNSAGDGNGSAVSSGGGAGVDATSGSTAGSGSGVASGNGAGDGKSSVAASGRGADAGSDAVAVSGSSAGAGSGSAVASESVALGPSSERAGLKEGGGDASRPPSESMGGGRRLASQDAGARP